MGKINLHNYEAFLIDYLDGNLNETAVAELKAFLLTNPHLEIDLEDMELPSFANEELNIDFKNDLKKTEIFIEDEEIINYLENNLSATERKAFEIKLLKDKELSLKLQAYGKTILDPEALAFRDKSSLWKTEDQLILNNAALAYVEGQLLTTHILKFEEELKANVVLQKEVLSYQRTKLAVDATIIFEDKQNLKKETKVIVLFSFRTIVSIAAAILLIIGLAFIFNYYNSKPVIENNELAKTDLKKTNNTIKNNMINKVDSNTKSNNTVPENSNYIAKNVNTISKNNSIKNGKNSELRKATANSLGVNKEKQNIEQELVKPPNESKLIANKTVIDTVNKSLLASNSVQPKYSKQNYLIATEADDEDNVAAEVSAKKGFWQRAARLANQVNKLGVKAIDGEETGNKGYALSFNSFSVEKK
ncbi:MAG: hypothetical protein H0W73_20030 [Bacteroidetes bacterium]|nr:hypothetical protein [Bacteroidota bacterium]